MLRSGFGGRNGGGDGDAGAGGVRGRGRGVPRAGGARHGIAPGLPGLADRVGVADRRQADSIGGGSAVRGTADRAAGPARRARDRGPAECGTRGAGGAGRRAHRQPRGVRAAQRRGLVARRGLDQRRPDREVAAPAAGRARGAAARRTGRGGAAASRQPARARLLAAATRLGRGRGASARAGRRPPGPGAAPDPLPAWRLAGGGYRLAGGDQPGAALAARRADLRTGVRDRAAGASDVRGRRPLPADRAGAHVLPARGGAVHHADQATRPGGARLDAAPAQCRGWLAATARRRGGRRCCPRRGGAGRRGRR